MRKTWLMQVEIICLAFANIIYVAQRNIKLNDRNNHNGKS